jgi:hypothetical protein
MFAAVRLRKSYEQGVLSYASGVNWSSPPSRFGPGAGPSEIKLQHLEQYQVAMKALGRLADVVLQCCLVGETLTAYGVRTRTNRQTVCGRLGAALDRLLDYYEDLEERSKRLSEDSRPQVAAQ